MSALAKANVPEELERRLGSELDTVRDALWQIDNRDSIPSRAQPLARALRAVATGLVLATGNQPEELDGRVG
jgi:hypothetical protein